jgi:hypothetical protein
MYPHAWSKHPDFFLTPGFVCETIFNFADICINGANKIIK